MLDKLRDNKPTSIELEASEDGHRIYEKSGFKSGEKVVTMSKIISPGIVDPPIFKPKKYKKEDLNRLLTELECLDQSVFGASRRYFIQCAIRNAASKVFISRKEGKVVGMLTYTKSEDGIQIGPWIHQSQIGALKLLKGAMHHISQNYDKPQKLTIHAFKNNQIVLQILRSFKFEVDFESTHMVWGEKLQARQDMRYFGLWSLALG